MSTATHTQQAADLGMIRQALALFMGQGDGTVVELRAPGTRQATISGYFDNPELAAQAAARLSGQAPGVYFTPNPNDPTLKARCYNRTQGYAKYATADTDILRRLWFLIDADPVRPAGISSTDTEHEKALQRMRDVWKFLLSLGFPEGIAADSGNGGHLVIPIDIPNTPESTHLLDRCLAALDLHFSDEDVTIDRTPYNAARIWKLYGTKACKGDSLPERPHRLTRILHQPATLEIAPIEVLEKLAALAPNDQPPPNTNGHGTYHTREFELATWISEHNLVIAKSGSWNGGRKVVLAVCPWNSAHTDNSAYIVQFASGAIAAGCHHNGCTGKEWKDLRALFEVPRSHDGNKPSPGQRAQTKSSPKVEARPEASVTSHSGEKSELSEITIPEWPESPGESAYMGLGGRFVELASRHSEADDVALLGTFLTMFGCAIGSGPHTKVGATIHSPRIFISCVGKSSKARKGESISPVRVVFNLADSEWTSRRILNGLSSGEGLIAAVRDRVEKTQLVKGTAGAYETVVVDEGVEDKRLLVTEPEFARVLQVMQRQGNTLNSVMRDGWDQGNLHVMTKTPMRATGAHICLVAHITVEELRRELTQTDAANGFANRFLWFAVRRAREIPRPTPFEGRAVEEVAADVATALSFARNAGYMTFDMEAGGLWDAVYHDLSAERDGLVWAILGRGEAQVLRLSMLYALLDQSVSIGVPHLQAALELWGYSERSALYIFGDAIGDPIADPILTALRSSRSLTRTQISALFSRHVSADQLSRALSLLERLGKAQMVRNDEGDGRPVEVWSVVD